MREVDFRYLQSALKSLNASTHLVLERGRVRAVLSRRASPYASHRQVWFETVPQPREDDVLLAVNYRKILLVGLAAEEVWRAAEDVGRDGRPFSDSLLGWNGPWAEWACEPVPTTLPLLQDLVRSAHEYGLVGREWMGAPLLYAAWLVPVVMDWDERGRPIFSWPDRPAEPESDPDPVDSDLPVEI